MKITIVVPTYNRPRALRLCLLSLAEQSVRPHEVMIADDGSATETRDTVGQMQQVLQQVFPIKHIWHEDRGFRKPKILNETVRQSTGDYLVFIDGDCMAHKHFIRAHIERSSPDAILSGKRVEIGKELTERILTNGAVLNSFNPRLIWDAVRGRSRKVEEGIMLKNPFLRRILHREKITNDGVWGCNFSLYKDLFMTINGCDEDFIDGSIEDNDLGIRVLNQGKHVRSVRGLAIIFHLWHNSSWSFSNEKYRHNLAILKRRIENKEPFCKNGIRKL
jgi:glycosyltransferase involved in cell wall biosynthesis